MYVNYSSFLALIVPHYGLFTLSEMDSGTDSEIGNRGSDSEPVQCECVLHSTL